MSEILDAEGWPFDGRRLTWISLDHRVPWTTRSDEIEHTWTSGEVPDGERWALAGMASTGEHLWSRLISR